MLSRNAIIATVGLCALLPCCAFCQITIPETLDLARLAHPSVANQLKLSDEQIAQVNRLLNARAAALTGTSDEARRQVIQNNNRELLSLLTDEQQTRLLQFVDATRLKFSFDEQKWSDVLQWVAEQADMTLVYDRVPDQKFSYRDSREYTVGEAIDLLNGVLLSKGFTLIRRDKLLIVAELSPAIPVELLPEVTAEELPKYGQFELVRMRIPLGKRSVDAVEKEISAVISPFGKMSVLPQSRQIIVVETASKMATINRLVADIPEPQKEKPKPEPEKPPAPVLAVYPIKNIDPAAALDTIKNLLGDDVKHSIDRTASTISVLAVPSQQVAVRAALDQLMTGSAPDQRARVQTFDVKTDDPKALRNLAQLVAPNSQITIDEANQRLIVFGSPTELGNIEMAIASDDNIANKQETIAAYPLTNSNEIKSVGEMLQAVAPDATIAASAVTNSIVVRATARDHEQIKQLVEQMNAEEGSTKHAFATYTIDADMHETVVRSIAELVPSAAATWDPISQRLLVRAKPLDHAQIRTLVDNLAFRRPEQTLRTYEIAADQQATITVALTKVAPQATVTWDTANQRLVVFAEPDEHRQIAETIAALAPTHVDSRQLHVYTFAPHLQPRAKALLTTIDQDNTPPTVVDDSQPGELAVLASESQHKRFDELLQQLRGQDQMRDKLTLQAYPVINVEPDSLQSVIKELFPHTKSLTDDNAKRLMIWATQEDQAAIRAAIGQLDVERRPRNLEQLKAYDLPGLDITNLTTTLSVQFPTMVLSVDRANKKLLAWGTEKAHEKLNETMSKLVQDHPPTTASIQVYPTAPRTPEEVLSLLANTVPSARLTPDVESGTIVALATLDEHKLIQAALNILPSPDDTLRQREFIAYDIRSGDAASAANVLAKITPLAAITRSRDDRQLLAWGTQTEHRRIRETLDSIAEAPDTVVQTYALDGVSGRDTIELLSGDLGPNSDAAISADRDRLIVRATTQEHQRLAKIIPDLLDQLRRQNDVGTIRVYELNDTSGAELVEILTPDLPSSARATISADGERLIVRAKDTEHATIATIVADRIEQLGVAEKRENRIYRPKVAEIETVLDVFDDLFPNLQSALDETGQFIAVTALPSEHRQLQSMFDAMEQGTPLQLTPKSYRLSNASADAIASSLRGLTRRNQRVALSVDADSNSILVVAPPREQQLIGQMIAEFDMDTAHRNAEQTTEIYGDSQLSSRTLENILQTALSKDAVVDADPISQRVIVRAAAADHAIARETVERLTEHLDQSDTRISHIYRIQSADPEVVENIFDDLAPRARIQADSRTRTVTVTASASEHRRMEQVLEQLENGLSNAPVPHTYTIEQSDPKMVYQSLLELFGGDDVSITWQPGSDSLMVMATDRQHEMVSKVINEFNKPGGLASDNELRVYSLQDVDGGAIRASLTSLLSSETSPPRIEFDDANNQLLAIATAKHHDLIADAIGRMKRERRDVEFFQLQANDAFSLELAIEGLFNDLPESAAPHVDSNIEMQQLIVRATADQMQAIRDLLTRMGETVPDPTSLDNRHVRTIPFYGDIESAMRGVQEIWPRMHSNQLRIIYPADYDSKVLLKRLPSNAAPHDAIQPAATFEHSDTTPESDTHETPFPTSNFPTPSSTPLPQTLPADDSQETGAQPLTDTLEPPPPVLVIPGDGKLTISSSDSAALDKFESLIRTFAAPERVPVSDVAIFGLRHASATEMAEVLGEFFAEIPSFGRMGKVIVVPDQRLNALVVHASKSGREAVKEILTVLDAGEDKSTGRFHTPRIVPVRNSAATRILTILQTVYKTQLSSNVGRRRQLEIPSGVDEDVTAILERLNASTASPLLTLEVDATTNSIIVLASPQLADEVTSLIGQLDHKAEQAAARGIRVISLKNIRSELLSDVLSELRATE